MAVFCALRVVDIVEWILSFSHNSTVRLGPSHKFKDGWLQLHRTSGGRRCTCNVCSTLPRTPVLKRYFRDVKAMPFVNTALSLSLSTFWSWDPGGTVKSHWYWLVSGSENVHSVYLHSIVVLSVCYSDSQSEGINSVVYSSCIYHSLPVYSCLVNVSFTTNIIH